MPSHPAPNDALELDTDRVVRERYSAAARAREAALCCPVDSEPRHLGVIPEEVLQRDYGCGDPSRHVRAGDTVLDLGSGGGSRPSPVIAVSRQVRPRSTPVTPPAPSPQSQPPRRACAEAFRVGSSRPA